MRLVLSATAATTAANEQTLGNSIATFGFNWYAQLQSEMGGNLVASPLSAEIALAMAYAGARGETASQMASALDFTLSPDQLESAFGSLVSDLNSLGQGTGTTLDLADALWVQQGFPLLPGFLSTLENDYGSGVNQTDFVHNLDASRQAINTWVANHTNDKIENLFSSLDPRTRLVLANATYLDSPWLAPFDPSLTRDAPFTLDSGSQVSVPTMHQTGTFGYMQSDGFQVLELPYADGRLSMDILLPTQDNGLSSLDANLVPADLNQWLQGLSNQYVDISLPRFTTTTDSNMGTALEALGMTDAFSMGADFSGIAPDGLMIQQVVQKAFINVNEAGTQAAAATGAVVSICCMPVPPSPPIEFNADHPFLFLIRDNQTGTVLFMGQVTDPTQTASDPSAPVITNHQPKVQDSSPPTNTNPPVIDPPPPPVPLPDPPTPPTTTAPGNAAPTSSPSLTPNQEFVTALYHDLLGRSVEADALTSWSNALGQGVSRGSVVADIEQSVEFRHDQVQTLYEHYLGRAADAGGLDFFTAALASGATVEDVAAELAGSQEFFTSHGGTSAGFIEALFAAALGRGAEAGAIAYFEAQLAGGLTRQQVAAQVLASGEYQEKLVGELVQQFLNRPNDPVGSEFFTAELSGGMTEQEVIAQIASSDEFLAKITR